MRARLMVALFVAAAAGCGSPSEPALTEIARTTSGSLSVVILSEDAAIAHDRDTFVVEFRSSDGSLVDVGPVKVNATMPMPGSSPMFGDVEAEATSAPGRYAVTSDLSMAGTWRLTLEWSGPEGAGSATFSPTVQ